MEDRQIHPIVFVSDQMGERRARYLARIGALRRVRRGIYVDAREDPARICRRFALRIAFYLYPSAYLAGRSALERGIAPDGILYLHAGRWQRTELPGFEIAISPGPKNPAISKLVIKDDLGSFVIAIPDPVQIAIEIASTAGAAANSAPQDVRDLDRLLMNQYGDRERIDRALDVFAERNRRIRAPQRFRMLMKNMEGERAMATSTGASEPGRRAGRTNFIVAWHRIPIGRLEHDGATWSWRHEPGFLLPAIPQEHPGALPSLIQNLLPEGWLEQALGERTELEQLRAGKRYLSNISIVQDAEELPRIPLDRLTRSLRSFARNYQPPGVPLLTPGGRLGMAGLVHAGLWRGDWIAKDIAEFERSLAQLLKDSMMPRLSGVQMKVPITLQEDGSIAPAGRDRPWTHILKLPNRGNGYEALGAVEWLCLLMSKAAGLDTAEAALFKLPDRTAPGLLVERFDIPQDPDDHRWLMEVDMCAALGIPSRPSDNKYGLSMEKVAKAVGALASDPAEQLRVLFRRSAFAWAIGDGDMHLKNIAMLKIGYPGESAFREIRLAPVYDAVTTVAFPGLQGDQLALPIGGKKDNLKTKTWIEFGRALGISQADATDILDRTTFLAAMTAVSTAQNPPDLIAGDAVSMETMRRATSFVVGRARGLGLKIDWEEGSAPLPPAALAF